MFKPQLSMIIITVASLMATTAFGQLFSFQTDPNNKTAATSPITPAMSADEFKSTVAKKSQQAQRELYKETQNNLKQQSSQMPLPNALPTAPKLNPQPQNQSTNTSQQNPSPALSGTAVVEQPATPTQTAPIPAAPTTATPNSPSNVAPVAPSSSDTNAPQQNQIYTGFGGGATATPNSNTRPSSQSSGGWSIKY